MNEKINPAEQESPVSNRARPPGALPSFAHIKQLPREERYAPLDAWVVWVNTNRGRMNLELERQLDEALTELSSIDVPASDFDHLERGFDEWLDSVEEDFYGER